MSGSAGPPATPSKAALFEGAGMRSAIFFGAKHECLFPLRQQSVWQNLNRLLQNFSFKRRWYGFSKQCMHLSGQAIRQESALRHSKTITFMLNTTSQSSSLVRVHVRPVWPYKLLSRQSSIRLLDMTAARLLLEAAHAVQHDGAGPKGRVVAKRALRCTPALTATRHLFS